MAQTDHESSNEQPPSTPPAGPPEPDRLVIGVPFELQSREAAHREMDALIESQARRRKQ